MPREPRIYIENVLYLITAKGDEDRKLFNDREDYSEYLKSLAELKREYGFKLYAFSLLPKSLYLLIELDNNVTISTIMHNLNSRYTKSYNSRYGKQGHLFQSRFKSTLIEKNEYLLRMIRYIHLLPRQLDLVQDVAEYPYSSFGLYMNERNYGELRLPDMANEISEVLGHFPAIEGNGRQDISYKNYVNSVGDQEIEDVQNLLYRKAFVGSKAFIESMRKRVQEHVKEEVQSREVRKPNMGLLLAGSLVVLFLSIATFSFYNGQTKLQDTLNVATNGMGAATDQLAKRVNTLQNEIVYYEEKENNGLGGFAWELHLTPVQQDRKDQSYRDHLQFKNGQVISQYLLERGFSSFDYTVSQQTHGKMIWQTAQTNTQGVTVRWYGVVSGGKMRGVFSEIPGEGHSRDFSFVSIRRVHDGTGAQNVVQ